eukprot:2356216-Pyramimonas_sp.AAC.1
MSLGSSAEGFCQSRPEDRWRGLGPGLRDQGSDPRRTRPGRADRQRSGPQDGTARKIMRPLRERCRSDPGRGRRSCPT